MIRFFMPIFLDNAATSFPKPESVYRAMDDTMRRIGVAPGRGGYAQGLESARLVFTARELLAEFFAIPDPTRLVFTHSATESLNLAVRGLLKPGDHVVTTTMEHNSLVRPLSYLEKRGIAVTRVAADRDGLVASSDIAAAFRPNTRLVALAHASNVTGTVQPVAEIGVLTRAAGIPFLVDAAQSAGCLPIDVVRMGIDLLAVPGHKALFGPPGTGLLYLAEGIELEPLTVGGTGSFSSEPEQPSVVPDRFESGTLNVPGIAGLLAGVEFIRQTGIGAIASHEEELMVRLLAGLAGMPGIAVHAAPAGRRAPVASFTVAGLDPALIGFRLDAEFGIAVRVGLHCAPMAHRTIGTFPVGTVRVSPGYFTTSADIDAFLAALAEIVGQQRQP
jgi:cysteine desulfurase family protein